MPMVEDSDENDSKPKLDIGMNMRRVSKFYDGPKVRPQYLNILTDFVDAEIFLIDGDSLLLELLCQSSLDWQHGGQFLHLTYLLERFLQYFKDKGGVFHVVFFKEVEIIWKSRPSMLLARQVLILHLQHNTPFITETSIASVWDKHWKEFIDRNIPAFLVLTDAENVPWKKTGETKMLDETVEFFFRCLLLHCLGQGLNCVFISGVQMTATKVMGYYNESTSEHRLFFRKYGKAVRDTWDWLMGYWRRQCTQENIAGCVVTENQIDIQSEVQVALQSPPQGGCREVATILACVQVLLLLLHNDNISKDTMKAAEDKVKLFLLQSALLKKLPLKYRAHTVNSSLLDEFCKAKDGKVYPFHEIHTSLWQILRVIESVLRDAYKDDSAANVLEMTSVADLMDGRLVHTLFWLIMKQISQGSKDLSLPQDVKRDVESAWEKVVALVNGSCHSHSLESQFFPLFDGSSTSLHHEERTNPDQVSGAKLKRLLDVGSVLVNEYVGDIRSRINAMAGDETEDEVLLIGKEFDEQYHWHSLRPLSDDYDRTKQSFTDKPPTDPKERKWYFKQKMKYVRYQRFYGNSIVGGVDKAKIITVKEEVAKKKKGKNKDGKMGEKAKRIIEQNDKKRKDEERKKDQEKWNNFLKDIDNNLKKDKFSTVLQLVDKYLEDCKTPELHLQALMKKAQSCLGAWQQTRAADAESNDMKYPVLLLKSVQKMAEDFHSLLTVKEKKKLAGFMRKLGFDDIAATLYDLPEESERKAQQLSVHTTSTRFQLDCMGHLLKRETRTDRDSRVDHFIPDTWQRELLDAVDKNESAVIVAPTSSGKTFASYYCMEKVLTQDNDGVVVYVSPTKALVNQVAATVYARFHRKQLPEGRAVYGVFTRDYRFNTLNSQILVTVPQCLEILFLSPRRQDWTKNVRYVIFDEVHCLGQEIGAEVWEHLLLLIRCPFLALSATIGNPDDLTRWLQAAQNFREQQDKQENCPMRKSYRIRLVTFHERYSDLEKNVYLPSPSNGGFSEESMEYEGVYDVKATREFVRLHPCAQLGAKQLQENSFPRDMDFTPQESLQLFDVMAKHWPNKESLQKLSPERYFEKNKFIDKSCARRYEKDLKREFKSWADEKHLEKVQAVIQSLNSVLLEKQASTEEEWTQLGMASLGKLFIWSNFPKLVEQLKAQGKLPALVFSFDRIFCEELAFGLAQHFRKREKLIKGQNNWKDLKLAIKRVRKAEKKFKRLRDGEAESTKEERLCRQVGQQYEKDFSVLTGPIPECTLAFTHEIGNEDLQKIMGRIWSVHGFSQLKNALRRGISYHHAGLKNRIRCCVEMLFREKYLQVVTATGTLALGIHMPCKTVVFAGDSPFLNSLQYRQMSGRAGRRGFDPVGNVVFFGVPFRKIQRLITANVPKIVGNFPINHKICQPGKNGKFSDDVLRKMVLVLSHLFGRRYLHPSYKRAVHLCPTSKVILEDLPDEFATALREYNRQVTDVFSQYLTTVAADLEKERGEENKLPLSGIEFPKQASVGDDEKYDVIEGLVSSSIPYSACSSFAALSGNSDIQLHSSSETAASYPKSHERNVDVAKENAAVELYEEDIEEEPIDHLLEIVRRDVYTDIHVVPILRLKKCNSVGSAMPLNAYALDFFKHGSAKVIEKENGIKAGEVFQVLKDFVLTMKSISTSLEELGPEGDNVVVAFKQLAEEYGNKFRKQFDADI
ncbi:probable ATP-dependent RNA helicase DDX60 [Pocillopora damicornis]|uniref:probable ATP-dependent RNA helicase DDX60 n=1 Tax=Pocillopora damicornis TaxID=46731 RepID=UPI000F5548B2|nr:probable ATP-dependent RNA helicase DDX60 [Pocillopora damicornis]